MGFIDFFKQKIIQTTDLAFGDIDIENIINNSDVSEVEIVLNKIATDFSTAKYIITNLDGEEITPNGEAKKVLEFLQTGNKIQGVSNFLYEYNYNIHKHGVILLYFKGSDFMSIPQSYVVLNNQTAHITYDYTKNLTNIDSLKEVIKTVTIANKPINKAELYPIFDTSFDFVNQSPKIRVQKISSKIELLQNTNETLNSAMKRAQLMLLVPDNGSSPLADVSHVSLAENDADIKKEKEQFKEQFSIKHGSISYSNKPFKVINTNPNNSNLKAFESLNHGLDMVSLMFGIDSRVIINQTKYDDMELVLSQYIAMLESESLQLSDVISKKFETEKKGFKVGLDFTKLKKLLIKENKENDA